MEPIVAWIGDIPIYHGERDDSELCLCGHDPYYSCPGWLHEPGFGSWTFSSVDGQIVASVDDPPDLTPYL
jgi:hypothetical protein